MVVRLAAALCWFSKLRPGTNQAEETATNSTERDQKRAGRGRGEKKER